MACLSDADAAIVRKHCDECPICRVAWDEAQKRFDALASLPAVETSSELIERTERRLAKAPAPSRLAIPLRWFDRRSLFGKFGTVAASVALVIGAIHLHYFTSCRFAVRSPGARAGNASFRGGDVASASWCMTRRRNR